MRDMRARVLWQRAWRDFELFSLPALVALLLVLVVAGCSKPYTDQDIAKLIPLPSTLSNTLDSGATPSVRKVESNSQESTPQKPATTESKTLESSTPESSAPQEEQNSPQNFSQALLSLLDDESLATLLEIALERNTNLLTLTSQIAQARESLGLASAAMLPKLSLNMGYNYSSGNYNRYQININQNTLNANLSLSWELDLFGKLNMLRKSKRYEYLTKLSNLSAAQVSLIGEVASNYFAYRRLASAISQQRQIIANAQQILALSQERYGLGLVDIATIESYKSMLASARSAQNALSLQQEQMKNSLLILLNTSETATILPLLDSAPHAKLDSRGDSGANARLDFGGDSAPDFSPQAALESKATESSALDSGIDSPPARARLAESALPESNSHPTPTSTLLSPLPAPRLPDISALPQEIILARDDVRASIATLNAQLMLKNSKKAALFPSLNLGGSLGQILFSNRGVGDLIWNITGGLLAPILNRATITKDYKIQKEALKQATYALENTLRVALGEVENAIKEVNTSGDSLQGRMLAFRASQELWESAQMRYELGLLDEESYLTSYNSFLSAQSSLDEAKLARISSVIMLYKALGGKLSYNTQTPANSTN